MPRKKPQAQPEPQAPAPPEPSKEIPKTIWVEEDNRATAPIELPSDTPFRYSPEEFRDGLRRDGKEGILFLHQAEHYQRILVHMRESWVPVLVVDPPKVLKVEVEVTLRYGEKEALDEIRDLLRRRDDRESNILDFNVITKATP